MGHDAAVPQDQAYLRDVPDVLVGLPIHDHQVGDRTFPNLTQVTQPQVIC